MTLLRDDTTFKPFQVAFVGRMCEAVYAEAQFRGVEGETLTDLVGAVCFTIATMIDGEEGFDIGSEYVIPMLVFFRHPDLASAIGPTRAAWMHEYIHSCVREIAERDTT